MIVQKYTKYPKHPNFPLKMYLNLSTYHLQQFLAG